MARLQRDFSGKKPSGSFAKSAKRPAYAIDLLKRRDAGERIGLVLLAVDDWHGGWSLADRPNVARIVAAGDYDIASGDFGCMAGLDVLVCGECQDDRFNAAVRACFAHGAASVWGEYADGVARLDPWRMAPGYLAQDRSVPFERFGAALVNHREVALLLGDGFYGMAAFDPVRQSLLARAGL